MKALKIASLFVLVLISTCIYPSNGEVFVKLSPANDGMNMVVSRDQAATQVVLTGTVGKGRRFTNGIPDDATVEVTKYGDTVQIIWQTNDTDLEFRDCFDLNKNDSSWFGGPERFNQVWPLDQMQIKASDRAYVTSHLDNFAVLEAYWLNSKGAFIYVDERTPLYVDQNNLQEDSVCFIANAQGVFAGRNRVLLNYTIGLKDDPKEAHLFAINNILGKPKGHPAEKMISEPIWTTWAKYKKDINDETVLQFSNDIIEHGYTGQLEIDDNWEVCYGDQQFSSKSFPNITDTVKALHEKNFRVTLWIHPFVDDGCNPVSETGIKKGYFVKNSKGETHASWWDNDNSNQIDFTQEEARKWFSDRLNKIKQLHGIDSFKFDAGETDYVDEPKVENQDIERMPNLLTNNYVRTVAQFGDLIEVRSAWKTQDLPIFIRMLDKDSRWGFDNGLKSLITTLLQMNMIGYPMVLPDMIGGNGYIEKPTAELLVRWSQANVFMPAMQFSYLPWELSSDEFDVEKIIKSTVDLHSEYSKHIIEAMEATIENGTPVNPPIWWVDPLNVDAHRVNDEFLLGEKILVAPVVEEGAVSRNIYLPAGSWKDGNTGEIFIGPINVENYRAPIDVLPYFIKQ